MDINVITRMHSSWTNETKFDLVSRTQEPHRSRQIHPTSPQMLIYGLYMLGVHKLGRICILVNEKLVYGKLSQD